MSADPRLLAEAKRRRDAGYRGNGKVVVTAEWDSGVSGEQADACERKEDEYRALLADYDRQCDALREGFDNVPIVSIFGAVPCLMAVAYGCAWVRGNGLINAVPRFRGMEEARRLEFLENIDARGFYPVIFERIEEFQQRWPHIPIAISDNQSPIDVLTQIVHGETVMLAMFDDGDEVHRWLDIVTRSIIEVNRRFARVIRNFEGYPGAYQPFGTHVADDDAAFLSPELYASFARPWLEQESRAFGGVTQHCCMGFTQNLANVASVDGFMGFDAMPDFNPASRILEAIEGKGVWTLYNYPFARKNPSPGDDESWLKGFVDLSEGRCGMIVNAYAPKREEALRLADSLRVHALRAGRR